MAGKSDHVTKWLAIIWKGKRVEINKDGKIRRERRKRK